MKPIQYLKLACRVSGIGIFLALGACSPKVDAGGYVNETNVKEQIFPGKTTREEVQNLMGSPSSQSSFGNETWYYITNRKEGYAFLKPEVVQQDVVSIEFDQAGIVNKVESYDRNSGQEFDLVKRTTPTEGHSLGFFEQALGNVGRFNKPGGTGTMAPGRRPGGGY